MSKHGFGKFLVGIGVGAGLGLLFAPKKGEETREDLLNKLKEYADKVKNTTPNEAKDIVMKKVNELEKEIKDLDKEKVMKIAKEKSDDIKAKADELVEFAKDKGTEATFNAAEELRKKAIVATKKF